MSTVVLPGSFDPFTLGHLDLARRAAALADRVVIAVSHNPSKKGLLGLDARKEAIAATMAQEDLADTAGGRTPPGGRLVAACRGVRAGASGRGLRSQLELADEEPMARRNRHLAEIATVFLLTESSLAHIASSLVREVHALGGEVSNMLPGPPQQALVAAPDVS